MLVLYIILKMKTTQPNLKTELIKKYHTLCTVRGMNKDDRDTLLAAYSVTSSKELTEFQLIDICNKLKAEPDRWRKKALAAVGAWLRSTNQSETMDKIKGIACRAAGCNNFNAIPVSRLRDLYYEFSKKARTVKNIELITSNEIGLQSLLN